MTKYIATIKSPKPAMAMTMIVMVARMMGWWLPPVAIKQACAKGLQRPAPGQQAGRIVRPMIIRFLPRGEICNL